MSVLSRLTGTFQNLFQLGKGGPKLKNSTGIVQVRNAADSAFADLTAGQVAASSTLIGGNALIKDGGAGIIQFRNSGDSAFARVRGGSPVGSDDLLTLGYFNSNAPETAIQMKFLVIESGNYATTYATASTLNNEAIVTRVTVVVQNPLDAGITLTVGTDEAGQAARFMGTADVDPQTVDQYTTTPYTTVEASPAPGSDFDLLVTLSGTPTTGDVVVIVEYAVPLAW